MLHPSRRQTEILRSLRLRRSCTIAALALEYDVSEETIRRDIRPLASAGLVHRVHGAVVSTEEFRETPFQNRLGEASAEKQRIAALTARSIEDGDSLIMDTGTTTSFVARALSEHLNLVVVTNSIDVAHTLSTRNGNRVYMTGGRLRDGDGACLGPSAVSFVEQFSTRHAVLSIKSVDADHGLMNAYLSEAEFSRAAMGRAELNTIVADHTKFGAKGFVTVCDFERIDRLVTSAAPPEPFPTLLAEAGVQVHIA